MAELIVAAYHTIDDRRPLRRALEEAGVAPEDLRISDYVDPVAANAPASIEKLHGFLFWLGGIPEVDVEAYRAAIARGRTVVAVRTAEAQAGPIADVLERFDPVGLGDPETMPERERVLAEQTGTIAHAELRSAPRRYVLGKRQP